MSDYRFEIGQRVRCGVTSGTVTHRHLSPEGKRTYMVRWDGKDWEIDRRETQLKPVPLRRGDVVQRDQADSIPTWTVVTDSRGVVYRRNRTGSFNMFAETISFSERELSWPVTVEIPAGDDGD